MNFVFEVYFKNTCILYLELFKFQKYFVSYILVSETDAFCIENGISIYFAQL